MFPCDTASPKDSESVYMMPYVNTVKVLYSLNLTRKKGKLVKAMIYIGSPCCQITFIPYPEHETGLTKKSEHNMPKYLTFYVKLVVHG